MNLKRTNSWLPEVRAGWGAGELVKVVKRYRVPIVRYIVLKM